MQQQKKYFEEKNKDEQNIEKTIINLINKIQIEIIVIDKF